MRHISIILCLLCYGYISAQPTTIKILGKHNYSQSSEAFGAIITLEENPNKCDPVLGFVTIEEQYKHLSESIAAKGSQAILTPVEVHTYSEYRKKTYRIEEPVSTIFDDVLTACNNQNATIEKTYYRLPADDFAGQDVMAVAALNDAKRKAHEIARHLNYKVIKVLNVDDETRAVNSLFDFSDKDPDLVQKYMEVMQLLSRMESSKESRKSRIDGAYNLWVTFEIEAL